MAEKKRIEVFVAGCAVCDEAVELVNGLACPACEVQVLDLRQPEAAKRAKELGVRSLPAVAVDGKLAPCCADRGLDEAALREAGLGRS